MDSTRLKEVIEQFQNFLLEASVEEPSEISTFNICYQAFNFGRDLSFSADESLLRQIILFLLNSSGRRKEVLTTIHVVRAILQAMNEVDSSQHVAKLVMIALAISKSKTIADAILVSIVLGTAGGMAKAIEVGDELISMFNEGKGGGD